MMTKTTLTLCCMLALAACGGPRGSVLSSEILSEQYDKDSAIEVIKVSRSNIAQVMSWPNTGGGGLSGWPKAGGGSASNSLRSGDLVDIVIWDNQENSLITTPGQKATELKQIQVSSDGSLFIPYVGEVSVSGLTQEGARAKVQQALEPIVPSVQVQLAVTSGQNNSADVVTGVAKPGQFPLATRNVTILSLLAEAGGIQSTLNHPVVRLIRDGKTYETYSKTLLQNASYNTVVRGGDKIMVVDDDRYFTSLGASGTEKVVYFDKPTITALEAMSMIGGLLDSRADPQGVLVLRNYPATKLRYDGTGPMKQEAVFVFDMTDAEGLFAARQFQIHPQDTVMVTESAVIGVRETLALLGVGIGLSNAVTR